jgi:hypothetical protein
MSGQLQAPGRRVTSEETYLGTHFIGGLLGLRAGLDTTEVTKFLYFYRQSNPNSLVVQPVA